MEEPYERRRRERGEEQEERSSKRQRSESSFRPPPSSSGSGPAGNNNIDLIANYFQVEVGLKNDIIQYDVKVEPHLERLDLVSRMLRPHEKRIGPINCDKSCLYSLVNFDSQVLECNIKDRRYSVKLTRVRTVSRKDRPEVYFQVFNRLFKRLLQNAEGFTAFNKRALFDRNARRKFDEQKLEIWPGYMTSLHLSATGEILINVSMTFKILRLETVDSILKRFSSHDEAEVFLIGQSVLTRYGRKDRTYRIKAIEWKMTPESTFDRKEGKISFRQYFREAYNEEIRNRDQPLLLAESPTARRQQRRNVPPTQTGPIYLIPEMCTLTGLSDDMRSDRGFMTTVSSVTRLSPSHRMKNFQTFIGKFSRPSNPQVKKALEDWQVKVSDAPIRIQGIRLVFPSIKFAEDKPVQQVSNGDWSNFWKEGLKFVNPKRLQKWLVITVKRETIALDNLMKYLPDISEQFGMEVDRSPTKVLIEKDDLRNWEEELRKNARGHDFVVCLLPKNTPEKYKAVKQFLTSGEGILSQCIVGKTISSDKVQSVITKISQQINSKLGGSTWRIDFALPPGKTMICGIDICHDKVHKRSSVAGFVATMNRHLDMFFSKTLELKREADLVPGLTSCMGEALQYFSELITEGSSPNGLPDNIIIYRDGVSDAQFKSVKDTEISEIRRAFSRFRNYQPKLIFIVVQKKINTRLFTPEFHNPPPGTVVDKVITSLHREKGLEEFFLIPQYVQNSATVCPSHYIILEKDMDAALHRIQTLTYNLCHLYFNWSGAIRVPAPVKYASKLAFHASQFLEKENHKRLTGRLFYL